MKNRKDYKIYIQDGNTENYIDYSDNLQLPFSIHEKSDERYDTGSLVLYKTNKKEPFLQEQRVKIDIYQNEELITSYHMMIEDDHVTTKFIGIREYYNHSISLIEFTKRLDRIFLPDFTVTNPATKSIHNPFRDTGSKWTSTQSTYSVSYKDTITLGYASSILTQNISTNSISFSNPFSDESYRYLNQNGEKILLPIPTFSTNEISISETQRIDFVKNTAGNNKHVSLDKTRTMNTLIVKYYFRDKTVSSSSFKPFLSAEINLADSKIVTYTQYYTYYNLSEVDTTNNKLYFIIGKNGAETVEIKAEVNLRILAPEKNNLLIDYVENNGNIVMAYSEVGGVTQSRIRNMFEDYYNYFELDTDDVKAIYDAYSEVYYDEVPTLGDKWKTYFKDNLIPYFTDIVNRMNYNVFMDDETYRYEHKNRIIQVSTNPYFVYSDFVLGSITASFQSVSDLAGDTAPEIAVLGNIHYNTVKDVLDKINLMMDPSERFKLQNILGEIMTTLVPEQIYRKRNVSEILFELGTLFSAYPYLDVDNNLSFIKVNPSDNPNYIDYRTEENVKMNSDTSTNSYTSNLTNMINAPEDFLEQYSYWPSKDTFAYANGNWKNKTITPDTNMIEIPNSPGIYYLKYIKVKNCLKTVKDKVSGATICDKNTVIDITDFCPEETYYNTLFTQYQDAFSNTHKSNCIYWTKGDNKINIDALEINENVAIWGTPSPEKYRISRAIFAAALAQVNATLSNYISGTDLSSVVDEENILSFQYQICYIDNIEGLVKTKKFNQDNINDISSNFNQTSNNIDSKDWLNASQINILRRGNNELDKIAYINDLKKLPRLGEIKLVNENGKDIKYLSDSISFTFDNNICSVALDYTRFYNKIDPSVAISKEYRQYEIYGKEAVTRDISIDRYLYIDKSPGSSTYNNHHYTLTGALEPSKRLKANKTPRWMLLFFKDTEKRPISYHNMTKSANVKEEKTKGILVPINYTTCGNTILLQASMLDNYAAGYYQDTTEDIGYTDITGTYKTSGAKTLKEVRYVDDLGEAEYVSVYILTEGATSLFNLSTFPISNLDEETAALATAAYTLDYEKDIQIKKDNREKLNFIYQIHFLTHETDIKWSPGICKYFFNDDSNAALLEGDTSLVKYYLLNTNITNDKRLPLKVSPDTGELILDNTRVLLSTNISTDGKKRVYSYSTNQISRNIVGSVVMAYSNPKSYETILHLELDKNITNITIPSLYFNFYKNRV